MTAPDAAAERLHNLYVDELRRSLIPPVHPMVNGRQTRAMIRRARAGGPGLYEAADANDLDLVGPALGRHGVDHGLPTGRSGRRTRWSRH